MLLGIRASQGSFNPLDLNPDLWLDSSDASTITESAGSVSQWDDKSGNANHATQATGTRQPTLIAASMNGNDIIRGDGLAHHMNIPNLGIHGTTDVSIFMVLNISATTGGWDAPLAFGIDGGLDGDRCRFEIQSGGTLGTLTCQDMGVAANNWIVADTLTTTDNILSIVSSSTVFNTWKNATAVLTETSTGTWTTYSGDYSIFATSDNAREIEADIAEVLIYKTALSDTDRGDVETYLSNKWGISI